MPPVPAEYRRYEVTGLLGAGGFGTVYRAQLVGPQDFRKDVAIKLLYEDASEHFVQRFRDEARILGLLRDNAVTVVDPPTRLNGRWAIVMEFVDGVSLERLLGDGPVPPSIATAIVGEVARALYRVWNHRGPNGPLRVLHRDIKPANIHVTPFGDVKILDFGIAKAEFEYRESVTNDYLAGTPGYIAPERFSGVEGPEGDVFSLGVVYHQLVTGEAPDARSVFDWDGANTGDAAYDDALDLAAWMREFERDDRPTAKEVETLCQTLLERHKARRLSEWAEFAVPEATAKEDDIVGTVLTETLSSIPLPPTDVPEPDRPEGRTTGPAWFVGGLVSASVASIVFGVAGFLVVLIAMFLPPMLADDPRAVQPSSPPLTIAELESEPDRPTEETEETEDFPQVRLPADPVPAPTPVANPTPAPRPLSPPVVVPNAVPPEVKPDENREHEPPTVEDPPKEEPEELRRFKVAVQLKSRPSGASAFVDGERVGTTPVEVRLTDGVAYDIRLELDDMALEKARWKPFILRKELIGNLEKKQWE